MQVTNARPCIRCRPVRRTMRAVCSLSSSSSVLHDVLSLHQSVGIQDNPKKIPETVEFYNSTKFGVDVLDQMARQYSVKAASRRWPVQVFYNILDLAGVNAWVLFKEVTGNTITRRDFLLQLATELSDTYAAARRREQVQHDDDEEYVEPAMKRRKCQVSFCKGNKTNNTCVKCKKAVCGVCTARVMTRNVCMKCENDSGDDNDDETVTYSLG